jgi:hypothetical protein
MRFPFVADGASRYVASESDRERLRAIEARYAPKLAAAGLFRRWWLRLKLAFELSRERRRLAPSPESLYAIH